MVAFFLKCFFLQVIFFNKIYCVENEEVMSIKDVAIKYRLNKVQNTFTDMTHKIGEELYALLLSDLKLNKCQSFPSDRSINKLTEALNKFVSLPKSVMEIFDFMKDSPKMHEAMLDLFNLTQTILNKLNIVTDAAVSDCLDLYRLGNNVSGKYRIPKYGIRVLCDMETDGGGWLVMMRRHVNVSKQVNKLSFSARKTNI